MAVHAIRHRGRLADIAVAPERCTSSLQAMAGSVSEIPISLFFADRDWAPSGMAAGLRRIKGWIVFCNGGGQSAFNARNDGDDFSGNFFALIVGLDGGFHLGGRQIEVPQSAHLVTAGNFLCSCSRFCCSCSMIFSASERVAG